MHELQQILLKKLPRLGELTFGCEVMVYEGVGEKPGKSYILEEQAGMYRILSSQTWLTRGIHFEVIGHKPSHSDILEALGEDYALFGNFELAFYDNGGGFHVVAQLPSNISDLSLPEYEETTKQLIQLLTK